MKLKYFVTACAISLGLSPHLHAELYRWVDSNNRVHYSDQPPPANAIATDTNKRTASRTKKTDKKTDKKTGETTSEVNHLKRLDRPKADGPNSTTEHLKKESPQAIAEKKRQEKEEKILDQAKKDLQPGSNKTLAEVEQEVKDKTKTQNDREKEASKKRLDKIRTEREEEEKKQKEAAAAKAANDRREYCETLKNNLAQIQPGARIRQINPKTKEAEFLTDEQINQQIKDLQNKQKAYCN